MININEFVKKFNLAAVEMLNQKIVTDNNAYKIMMGDSKVEGSFCKTDAGMISMLIESMTMAIMECPLALRDSTDIYKFAKKMHDIVKKLIPDAMPLFKSICKNAGLLHIVSKAQEMEDL